MDLPVVPHGTIQHPLHIEIEHAFSLEYPGNVLEQTHESRAAALATVDSKEPPTRNCDRSIDILMRA